MQITADLSFSHRAQAGSDIHMLAQRTQPHTYTALGDELADVLEVVLAGEVVTDRAVAERLVRVVGALVRLHEPHPLDNHGRWPRRAVCTVRAAFASHMPYAAMCAPRVVR